MAGTRLILPRLQFFDSRGAPLVGGKITTYEAGTTTPLATYTDSGLGTPNTNPVVLDGNSYAPDIFMDPDLAYKVVLSDAEDVTIWTADNVLAGGQVDTGNFSDPTNIANLVVSTTFKTVDPYIDVRAYGAVGDGVADDTASIASAIADSSGKVLSFPSGTYNHTGLILDQKTHLLMDPGAKLFLIAGSDTASIAASVSGTIIEGGTVDGNRANQSGNTSHAIIITADDVTVRNTILDDHDGFGINARDVNNLKVHDCKIIDTYFSGIYYVGLTKATSNIEIANNSIDRSAITGALAGILIYGLDGSNLCTDVRIVGNYVNEKVASTPASLVCITGRYLNRVTVSDNTLAGGQMGISIDTSAFVTQTGNTCFNHYLYGIEFANLSNSVASGNVIDGNSAYTQRGIQSSSVNLSGVIADNTISGIMKASIALLGGAASHFTVTGNSIIHAPTTASDPAIQAAAADYFVISNNSIKGDGTALDGIFLENPGTGSIVGNTITNLARDAVTIYLTDGLEHDDILITGNCLENTTEGVKLITAGSGGTFGDNVIVNNNAGSDSITLADNATPPVFSAKICLTGGTTTITDFDDGITNQIITVIAEHSITITDGTNIFLSGSANFDMTATDTLTLICKADNKWYEVSRGDNGA